MQCFRFELRFNLGAWNRETTFAFFCISVTFYECKDAWTCDGLVFFRHHWTILPHKRTFTLHTRTSKLKVLMKYLFIEVRPSRYWADHLEVAVGGSVWWTMWQTLKRDSSPLLCWGKWRRPLWRERGTRSKPSIARAVKVGRRRIENLSILVFISGTSHRSWCLGCSWLSKIRVYIDARHPCQIKSRSLI